MDLIHSFTIRESSHRIHNPLTGDKLAALGRALALTPGTRILDLASGSGEMLCTWARDQQVRGTGVDLNEDFVEQAQARSAELGVTDRVTFLHGDAAGYVAEEPVELVACLGATWIGDGVPGTVELLQRSLLPGGIMLVGEPYWLKEPPDQATIEACEARSRDDFLLLADLIESFTALGYDLVEMMLADGDSWDRYRAAQWLNLRRWLDRHPDHEDAAAFRDELSRAPAQYARYERDHLGWGVFALMRR